MLIKESTIKGISFKDIFTETPMRVLHLDASISGSYPGSGTVWYDLSGNGSNAQLVNGPTFSSNNSGYISFDGTNDYTNFIAPNLGTTTTVEMWLKPTGTWTGKMLMGWLSYDVYTTGGTLSYNTANSDAYGISAATVNSLGITTNWAYYVFEMRSDVSYTNNKIYINGALQTLSQLAGTQSAANRNFNSGLGRFPGWRANLNYLMQMDCAVFSVWNRALTQAEITANFESIRGRFGI